MNSVLLAHAQPGIARVVEATLAVHGFSVETARSGDETAQLLSQRRFDALVVDVGVPGVPSFELIKTAKALSEQPDQGAPVVVLVSSVYRKTSYKRRPARLYGADDYVEIHHLGDMLPGKLMKLLSLTPAVEDRARVDAEVKAADALRIEGDRAEGQDADSLASLIVSDVILYNGDAISGAQDVEAARGAVGHDLEVARDLLGQLARAAGVAVPADDPIGRAFDRLMVELAGSGEGGS